MSDVFSLQAYTYSYPQELVATHPLPSRDRSRLLVVNKGQGSMYEAAVADLPDILDPHDALIFNDTRVYHGALEGVVAAKKVECVLTKQIAPDVWRLLAKPARRLCIGSTIWFSEDLEAIVLDILPDGSRNIQFSKNVSFQDLQRIGSIPLPPYMKRKAVHTIDEERYQTIYGEKTGSAAAPTAGLHFTQDLLQRMKDRGLSSHFLTLHVGTGTFLPIRTPDIRHHTMHSEPYEITAQVASQLNTIAPQSRKIAVGTTSCRVLETVADTQGCICPGDGQTNLFIFPGYQFKYVTSLFTNFHTPESSLLVLVATFMGYDLMREAYAKAIEKRFRLFSYGDAMLII